MLWAVLIGGVCGAVAGALAALVVPDARERRGLHMAVTLGLFLMLNGAARSFVLPQIRAWEARTQAQEIVHENRALDLLVREHPELGREFEGMLVKVASSGASREQARQQGLEWGRTRIAPYFERYVRQASDESLTAYISVTVELLDELGSRERDACYGMLFGVGAAPKSLTEAHSRRMSDAMADVVESALERPHPATSEREGDRLLQDVVDRLQVRHGDEFVADLSLLAQPNHPRVDRARVCATAVELYREILRMPDPERGRLLRYMLAAES